MIPSEEVLTAYLTSKQIGSPPSQQAKWPVFAGKLPNEPHACIVVYRAPSPMQGRIQRTGESIRQEGLQIRVREKEYLVGEVKIGEISDALDKIKRAVLSVGTKRYRIQSVTQITPPFYMGPDSNDRVNFTLNCLASIKEI